MARKNTAEKQVEAPPPPVADQPDESALSQQPPSTALTVGERAKVALKSDQTERDFRAMLDVSKTITAITNADGRAQCHARLMDYIKARTALDASDKVAREDLIAVNKGIIAERKRLGDIIAAEETRLRELRDAWDAVIAAEKAAKAEAERKRVAAIRERIDWIRLQPGEAVGETSAAIQQRIETLVALPIDGTFAELEKEADGARETALVRLRNAHTKALAHEESERRLAEGRAELDRQREAQEREQATERVRIAEEERAAKARQDAEREAEEARQREASRLGEMRMQEIMSMHHQVMIAESGRLGVRKGDTRECIVETLEETESWTVTEEKFGPLLSAAEGTKQSVISKIRNLLTQWDARIEQEQQADADKQQLAADRQRQQEEADRFAAERAEAERQESRRKVALEAEERRLADERAAFEREQEAARVPAPSNVIPLPHPIPAADTLPEVTVTVGGESVPSTLEETEPLAGNDDPDVMRTTIDLRVYLMMESVCKAAKEWSVFQERDSKLDQKTDHKLAQQARAAEANLLAIVEQLP